MKFSVGDKVTLTNVGYKKFSVAGQVVFKGGDFLVADFHSVKVAFDENGYVLTEGFTNSQVVGA